MLAGGIATFNLRMLPHHTTNIEKGLLLLMGWGKLCSGLRPVEQLNLNIPVPMTP